MTEKRGIKLTIVERLKLLECLPKEGTFADLKILRKLKETLSFDEAEHKEFGIELVWECPDCKNRVASTTQPKCSEHDEAVLMTPTTVLTWKPEASVIEKEVFLGSRAKELTGDALKKLDNASKLTESHISIYEKFVAPAKKDA